MTFRCQLLPPRPLPRAIVDARLVEITTTASASKLAITSLAARLAAHALRGPRGARGRERLAALGAAARSHAQASRHAHDRALTLGLQVDHYPAARRARSRGAVDHDLAAEWITGRVPLKARGDL